MLQLLNSKIQGWFAWLIISVIAGTFALFGVEHYLESRGANIAKAVVNGETITAGDFDVLYRRQERQMDMAEQSITGQKENQRKLLDGLIKKSVGIQSALSSGFQVSGAQVIAQIQNVPQFLEEGRFSVARYQQALNQALFTPESFRKEVWEDLLLNQQRFAFMGTAVVFPYELDAFVKLNNQTRDYDYLRLPYEQFLGGIKLSDKAVEDYYQSHREMFKTEEQVVVKYVRLSMSDIRKGVTMPESAVKQYYDENQSNYTTPAEWQVAHIFYALTPNASPEQQQKIEKKADAVYQTLKKSPEAFEQMVKSQSDDKLSALHAGVLPWIVAGQSDLDKALVDLTAIGQISPPVKTAHGYEIFKLLATKKATIKPFDTVKQDILKQLTLEKAQAQYSQSLEQLSDLAYQSPDSLSPTADALHLKIEKSEAFSQKGGNTELTRNPNVIKSAFSTDVLKQGNNSEPIQLDKDSVIVLRVAKHIPVKTRPFATVKPEIEKQLAKQQAEQAAKQFGQTLLTENLENKLNDSLFDNHHLAWQNASNVSRNSQSVNEAINKLAFQLGRVGAVMGHELDNGDYVLIRLKKVDDGRVSQLSKDQTKSILEKLEARHGSEEFDLYMSYQLKQAKITR
jgi:peptidyl-prolyl cis-trans isomerase D